MKNKIIIVFIALICSIAVVLFYRTQFQKQYDQTYAKASESAKDAVEKVKTLVLEGQKLINKKDIKIPKEGQQYANVSIDRVHLDKPVYYGDNESILDIGVGQYMNSGLPGEGRPILLAGHNGTHFNRLQFVEKGDIVKLKTSWGNYEYKVYDIKIMTPEEFDTDCLNDQKEYLIMYSCYPFDQSPAPQRFFVYASLVSGPAIREDVK